MSHLLSLLILHEKNAYAVQGWSALSGYRYTLYTTTRAYSAKTIHAVINTLKRLGNGDAAYTRKTAKRTSARNTTRNRYYLWHTNRLLIISIEIKRVTKPAVELRLTTVTCLRSYTPFNVFIRNSCLSRELKTIFFVHAAIYRTRRTMV